MKSYKELSGKYLSGHKKNTQMAIISVALAVALIVGIFSMLDALILFEKEQIIASEGNYHILIRNATLDEIDYIEKRVDIESSGLVRDIGQGSLDGDECWVGSMQPDFAKYLNYEVIEGQYPVNNNK